MITYTGAVFNNGPIARLLDLCVASQEPGAAPLEDELVRFCRSIQNSAAAAWATPPATVASLLDLVAEQLEQGPACDVPIGFTERLAEAAETTSGPAHLRMLAGLIRLIMRGALPDFQELEMSSWEAGMKFERIRQFWWWADSGEFDDYLQGLREGMESEHPDWCRQEWSLLAAELQQALLIFSSRQQFDRALKDIVPSASPEVFRDILRTIHTHFAEQH
ncbi:hypothetical protein ACGFW5_07480 [Streptomyces sp. NPDC048416]|uniref:hypothetical protein n=1 Tax=Streptomyces sp. NPDC048416 TaxID=3365546 RepID=UPI003714F3D0